MSYFFILEGEQVGPISRDQVRERIAAGRINLDTPVWRRGMAQWGRVGNFTELLGEFSELSGTNADSSTFAPPSHNVVAREYANLGSRFASAFIDFLVLIIPVLVATSIVPLIGGLLVSVPYFGYFMTRSGGGRTLGDRAMRVETVDEVKGRPMQFQEAILWALVYNLLGWLGWVWCLFDEKRRMLHNIVSRTVTYRK